MMECLRCNGDIIKECDITDDKIQSWTDLYYYCENCGAKYLIEDDSGE